jgi:hypothetical protein
MSPKAKTFLPLPRSCGIQADQPGGRLRIMPPRIRLISLRDHPGTGGKMSKKTSPEEFVRLAIQRLRNEPYKGIHSVYSGFNEAFKKYFNGQDPIDFTNGLSEEGKIVIRPIKGGVVLYLPEEAPQIKSRGDEALKKMGLI